MPIGTDIAITGILSKEGVWDVLLELRATKAETVKTDSKCRSRNSVCFQK